jgi:peroxiredoxin
LTTLREQLDRRRRELRATMDPTTRTVLEMALKRLEMLQIKEHALALGDPLPDLALPDTSGAIVSSEALLARGPLVLSFFRGGWCPYCDLALRAMERARPAFEATGASLVAITPEAPAMLAETARAKVLTFTLLSDPGSAYAKLCGLHFELTDAQVAFYTGRGLDLPARHAGSGWELPVPATYLVGRDGIVAWAFVNPDWTRRAEPDAILAALQALG